MTLRDALLEASTSIARRDAETLLAHTLHHDHTEKPIVDGPELHPLMNLGPPKK